ncbi:hypothetical protein QJ48_06585 [Paenibacillus sp. A3]|uniref:hypothetical protein n=1 Tax=Paenibacillus sp. A3 TaxID=1337054 RepID=UPI0006D564AA|nr:hypothetical protein [Paenibacillus sp. A3]KPV60268.1 hypothetical protein QJ48_06585 [Paenibacillus sp. A3]
MYAVPRGFTVELLVSESPSHREINDVAVQQNRIRFVRINDRFAVNLHGKRSGDGSLRAAADGVDLTYTIYGDKVLRAYEFRVRYEAAPNYVRLQDLETGIILTKMHGRVLSMEKNGLSELRPGQYINYNSEIITKEQAEKINRVWRASGTAHGVRWIHQDEHLFEEEGD